MHCCICTRVCGHTTPPTYCDEHSPARVMKSSPIWVAPTQTEQEKFFAHLNNGEVELVPQYGADEKVHYITVRILRKAGE